MMFNESERQIFGPYFNGHEMMNGDPVRIYRHLVAEAGGDLETLVKQHQNLEDGVGRATATDKLIRACAVAFGLTLFDPRTTNGLEDARVLDLLDRFFEWCKKKEETSEKSQMSPPTTDSRGSDGPPLMMSSLASGSIAPDKVRVGLGPLNSGSTLPLAVSLPRK